MFAVIDFCTGIVNAKSASELMSVGVNEQLKEMLLCGIFIHVGCLSEYNCNFEPKDEEGIWVVKKGFFAYCHISTKENIACDSHYRRNHNLHNCEYL